MGDTTSSVISSTLDPIFRQTWRVWPQIRRPRSGGNSANPASSRLTIVLPASGGHQPRKCFTAIDAASCELPFAASFDPSIEPLSEHRMASFPPGLIGFNPDRTRKMLVQNSRSSEFVTTVRTECTECLSPEKPSPNAARRLTLPPNGRGTLRRARVRPPHPNASHFAFSSGSCSIPTTTMHQFLTKSRTQTGHDGACPSRVESDVNRRFGMTINRLSDDHSNIHSVCPLITYERSFGEQLSHNLILQYVVI